MKTKLLLGAIAAGALSLSGLLFAQTTEMTGTVVAVSRSSITVQKGTEQWVIQRTVSTKVTGDLKTGATVTISYNEPDAQKKEGPLGGTPTPAAK